MLDRFSDVEKEHIYVRDLNGYYEVFRKHALTTPIGCFFSASADASCFLPQIGSTTASNVTIEHKISTNLFFDFCDDDEQDTLSIDDFIIVNYNNEKMLLQSLCNSLENYGVKKDELLFRKINYDRTHNNEWICPEIASEDFSHIPFELFYKDSAFSEQKEMRIAVLNDAFKCRISNPFNKETNSFQTAKNDITSQLIVINKQAEYKRRSAVVRRNETIRLDICFSITRVNDC